ncbi:MAG: dihydrolipoyllysine-residue acetyltransferase [Pseudomonadota bacterium]
MASTTNVIVPDIGDFQDVEIVEVHVSAGDQVSAEDPLITLETDKAAMDVPAPQAGKVVEVLVNVGDKVSEGAVVLVLEGEAEEAAAAPEADAGAQAPAATEEAPAAPAEAAPAAEPELQTVTVKVPDIGDFTDVEIIEVHVAVGDDVDAEGALITLETDKAAMDIPAPSAGKIVALHVAAGDTVSEGSAVADLETMTTPAASTPAETAAPSQPAPAQAPAAAAPPPPKPASTPATGALPPIDEMAFAGAHASPSVRKFARELGADLGRVRGTGFKSRITKEDVKAFVKSVMTGTHTTAQALPSVPKVDFARYGEIELKRLTRVQKISGPRLHASWVNLPHVTQFDQADITDLEALRKELKPSAAEAGVKLTPLAFTVMACVRTLQEFPQFNTSLDEAGENLVFKKYINIGFAADTPNGLVVPVIRDADRKDLYTIARELTELSTKARDGKLPPTDMQGGTFTISSLGGIGGTAFTPIINAPEVAILGVSRSAMAPVYQDGEFVPRLMLPLSLSYDHRVIDGAAAARFTTHLGAEMARAESYRPEDSSA